LHLLCLCAVEVTAPTVTAPPSSPPSTNSSGAAGRALLVDTPEVGQDGCCAPGPERLAPGGNVGLCLVALLVASSVGFVYARQHRREDDASGLAEARNKDLDDLAPGAAAGEGGSGGKRGLAFLGDAARGGDGCSGSAVCTGDPDGARDEASFDGSASRSVVSTSSDSVRARELDRMVTRKDWEGVVMAAAQLDSSSSVQQDEVTLDSESLSRSVTESTRRKEVREEVVKLVGRAERDERDEGGARGRDAHQTGWVVRGAGVRPGAERGFVDGGTLRFVSGVRNGFIRGQAFTPAQNTNLSVLLNAVWLSYFPSLILQTASDGTFSNEWVEYYKEKLHIPTLKHNLFSGCNKNAKAT
jgi:hypothetical protein